MTTAASESEAPVVDEREYVEEWTVAHRVQMSIDWVRRARSKGGGPPFIKLGHCVRYPVADLNAWLEARKLARLGVPLHAVKKEA